MCLGILTFTKKYSNKALEECCRQTIVLNKQKYTIIKNTISVIADDLGEAGYHHSTSAKKEPVRGGYVDLHDRSVIASITDRNITSDLAKRTLEKAIHSQPGIDLSKLLVHSDQGSQYTSKEFTEFCEKLDITQSMSKAGYPYDNAPMERYFNTLKNDLIYQHYYHTEDELYIAIEEFAYVQYNHVRPHSYNNYKMPYEARYGVA